MKNFFGVGLVGCLFVLFSFACTRNLYTPLAAAAPQTITVSIASGSLGAYSGYYYTASGFSNNTTTGVLNLTAHVGDTVILPTAGIHPLYLDAGTSTCIYSGINTGVSQSYNFTSTGIYYFHCGFHAQNCSAGLASCGSTNCTALAGVITVN
jgi:hypothetical protein